MAVMTLYINGSEVNQGSDSRKWFKPQPLAIHSLLDHNKKYMRKKYTTVTRTILEEKRILLGNLSRNYNKVTKRIASGDIFTRLDCGKGREHS